MKNLLCLCFFFAYLNSFSQLVDTVYLDIDLGYRYQNKGYFTNLTNKGFIIEHEVNYSDKLIKQMKTKGYRFINTYWLSQFNFPTNHLFHSRRLDLQLYNDKYGVIYYDEYGPIQSSDPEPRLIIHSMPYDSLKKYNYLKDTFIVDPEINAISYPFFMKNTVTSNLDFKEFYQYVLDSTAKEICYSNSIKAFKENTIEVSIKKTLELLNLSKREIKNQVKNIDLIDFESLRTR